MHLADSANGVRIRDLNRLITVLIWWCLNKEVVQSCMTRLWQLAERFVCFSFRWYTKYYAEIFEPVWWDNWEFGEGFP